MTKSFFIRAHPRGEHSRSIQVARTYLDALKAPNAALEVDGLPMWETGLPTFDGDKTHARMTSAEGARQ